MKFTSVITGLFAATAIAAPATAPASSPVLLSARSDVQPRTNFFGGDFNDFKFNNKNFGYFGAINNGINFEELLFFGQKHNLDITVFKNVFIQQQFDIHGLIQLHLAHQFLTIAKTGVFELFDLSTLKLGGFQLGVNDNLFGLDLQQFVLQDKIETIAQIGAPKFHSFGI